MGWARDFILITLPLSFFLSFIQAFGMHWPLNNGERSNSQVMIGLECFGYGGCWPGQSVLSGWRPATESIAGLSLPPVIAAVCLGRSRAPNLI